ncbi:hypothetical protein [Microbispora sp. NBRC 16548]|uniref:hypothetical protein n=1 Tax=Microbispora sp. NBRC 16548 TaxID=3030994 RepID=UPI00161F89B4|nr:hypothetical protein [Microbispora sp. NBRC 16548]GLX06679.1 hypothetical protein Misp03_36060 [Microbispora sp. NBRC 16548]
MTLIRNAVEAKARLCGWTVEHRREAECTALVLTRDGWELYIAYDQGKAFSASLTYPGSTYPSVLSLGLVSRYLSGNRAQMSAVRRRQRIVCGGKAGVVEDIIPDDRYRVRLVVHYDDNSVGEPYTTFVRAEQEEVAV